MFLISSWPCHHDNPSASRASHSMWFSVCLLPSRPSGTSCWWHCSWSSCLPASGYSSSGAPSSPAQTPPSSPRRSASEYTHLWCLVHIWLAMGIRSPYPARILPVSPFPCGPRKASLRRQEAAVRFLYGFTGSAASTIWFSEKFDKFGKIVSP